LNVVLKVNPVKFKFNQLFPHEYTNEDVVGIIAQEMDAIAPYTIWRIRDTKLCPEGELTDVLMFDYAPYVFVLINAVKELNVGFNDTIRSLIDICNEIR
jgi:trimeric autotransporter adhesin